MCKEVKRISDYDYLGPSMIPLFQPGDGLIVEKDVEFSQLRCGDVISFKSPQGTKNVVHRIVKISDKGLITRGDNNAFADPWYVTLEHESALVTAVHRGNKTHKVHSGRIGMLIHYRNLFIRYMKCNILRPVCRIFIATAYVFFGFFRKFKLFDNRLEIRRYKTKKGIEDVLMLGKYKVGYRMDEGNWYVRLRWKIFINLDSIEKIRSDIHVSRIKK